MTKTVVTYDASKRVHFIGQIALCTPIDHPATRRVTNTKEVMTSRVVRKMVNGEFETQNTIYIPDRPVNPFIDKVE